MCLVVAAPPPLPLRLAHRPLRERAAGVCRRRCRHPAPAPLTATGFSKHLFALWALRRGLLATIVELKFFTVYRRGETHKGARRSGVHTAYQDIQAPGAVQRFTADRPACRDGEQTRNFVPVEEIVPVLRFYLDWPERAGLFHCGTGRRRTWLALAPSVCQAMRRAPQIPFIDLPTARRRRDQSHTEADNRKLRAAGYTAPFTSLADGGARVSGHPRDGVALGGRRPPARGRVRRHLSPHVWPCQRGRIH